MAVYGDTIEAHEIFTMDHGSLFNSLGVLVLQTLPICPRAWLAWPYEETGMSGWGLLTDVMNLEACAAARCD